MHVLRIADVRDLLFYLNQNKFKFDIVKFEKKTIKQNAAKYFKSSCISGINYIKISQ